jgi:hypothetical protein
LHPGVACQLVLLVHLLWLLLLLLLVVTPTLR